MQPTLRQSCPTSSNAKTGRGKTTLYSLQSSLLSARFPLHQWIFGQTEPLPNELRELFTLPRAHGVLGIPDLKPEAPRQYAASKLITVPHVGTIRTQGTFMPVGEQIVEDLKRQQQSLKTRAANLRREAIDASLSPNLPRSTMKATDKGVSSWLNAVPFEEQGLTLNKQQFRDSLSLRYNLQLADLPSHCRVEIGDRFTVRHALSCTKGRFVAHRHDGIRNFLTSLLSQVCKNVEVEPHFQIQIHSHKPWG